MNTRLQVEHPVTEWVTGLDLVAWQIRVAQGEPLPEPTTPPARGHSIEARIYAEDPAQNFLPSPGVIQVLSPPGGPFVRNDTGAYSGYTVPSMYDPMIGKVSVWAPTRPEAIARLRRALSEYVITGITTNISYLKAILEHPEFQGGDYDTHFLDRAHAQLVRQADETPSQAHVLAAAVCAFERDQRKALQAASHRGTSAGLSPWRFRRP
jgi:acetyl-CoA carboxylase, biotin carboxylase subunit